MLLDILFLHASTFQQDLPTGLALCIVPFILGWLAAYLYYSPYKTKSEQLTKENAALQAKIDALSSENTDLRVKLTQADSDIHDKNGLISKLKGDVIVLESERNLLQIKLDELTGGKKEAAPAAAQTITFNGVKYNWDDLKIVEGVGPKIAELLQQAGIKTWQQLADADPARLREILDGGGSQFNIHEPATWPEQARLAVNGEWDALKKLQDELDGGKA